MPLSKLWAGSLVMLAAVACRYRRLPPLRSVQKSIPKGAARQYHFAGAGKPRRSYGKKVQLGTTPVVRGAITSGELESIRNIPAMARFSLKMKTMRLEKCRAGLRESQKARCRAKQLIWLTPAPANNTWTIAVRQEWQRKTNSLRLLT